MSRSCQRRLRAAVTLAVSHVLRNSRLLSRRMRGVSTEGLESRMLFATTDPFGSGSHYFDQFPFSSAASVQSQEVVQSNPNATGTQDAASSAASVRYADGHPEVQVTDLSSSGFGRTWGVTRSWSPDMTGTGSLGNHWFLNQMPQLVQESTADANRPSGASATIILVASGTDQRWFDYFSGTGWVERYGGQDSLVAGTDSDGKSVYVLTDTTGTQTHFFDFSSGNGAQAGQFRSSYDPYGNVTKVTSTDAAGEITEVQRANGSTIESWLYTYSTLGGASVITNIKLRRSTDGGANYYTVSQTQDNYYGSGASNGTVNDLASVQTLAGGPGTLTGSLTSGTGLTLSQPYYYEITAMTAQGETSVSPEFEITPTSSGTQDVNLSWSSYPGATNYNVYRGTTSGGEQLIASGSTGTTYTDSGSAPLGSAPPPDVIGTDYYVYWLSGQTVMEGGTAVTQPAGGLKFVFSAESYARMAAALPSGTTPDSATTAELSPYADSSLAYDSSGRVYQATVAGKGGGSSGQGTFTFAYSASSNSTGFDHWASKTAEALPDGSTTNTVYSNYAGEPMLDVTASGSSQWGSFEEYNSSGQVILRANPSALNLPSALSTLESNADLLNNQAGSYQYLGKDTGEIEVTSYYGSTTATVSTVGGVAGYFESTSLGQGQSGTAVSQETRAYYSHSSSGSVTIYPVAADTQYRNSNGTGGETTSYGYSWYSGTNQPSAITETLPTVTTAENGPNTTDSVVYTLDQYNRTTQFEDGDGYYQSAAYDMGTGGITQTVVDSGTGGLALTTYYDVNGSGNPTQITDPKGNVTKIVYLGLTHETRVYPGWHEIGTSGTYTTTGPVQITREYFPAANAPSGQRTLYSETLTIDPPVDSTSSPSGGEAVNQSDIQSLSRSLTNAAGQVYETDAYASLAGLAYSTQTPIISGAVAGSNTSSGNYSATLFGYDSRGRQDHVVDPTGTVVDTTIDALGRVTSVYEGTNDSTSNNMVDVGDDSYDQRAPAPAGPTLGHTSGGSLSAATYYVVVTYVSASGESVASTESSLAVSAANLLTINSPAARTGATGYNVYVATASGQETQQNTTPISLGTNWTESTGGLVAGSLPPVNGIGDSNLTQITVHPGGGAADDEMQSLYDWRNRLVGEKLGVQSTESASVHRPIYYHTLDNLGEVTGTFQYDADGMSLSDFSSGQPSADAGKLRAEQLTSYDEQQRPYLYQTYEVNQTTGAVSSTNILSTNLYYNKRNDVIAESDPGGLWTKYGYDGANRETLQSSTDGGALDGATANWANASVLTHDVVLEQLKTAYDADSNVTETVDRQRFDNDPNTARGNLSGPGGGNWASRDYYTDYYYDAAKRLIDTADAGTNGGSAWSEPTSPNSASDTYLLTSYGYAADAVQALTISGSPTGGTFTLTFNGQTTGAVAYNAPANGAGSVQAALAALSNIGTGNVAVTGGNGGPYTVRFIGSLAGAAEPLITATSSLTGGTSPSVSAVTSVIGGDGGRLQTTTDPRGLVALSDCDLLGRTLTTIAAFTTGIPSNSTDRTTVDTYDADGHVLTSTAVQPTGGSTPNQTTAWVYGVGGTAGTDLFSNDLQAKIEYPDKTTGQASTSASSDQSFGYNFLGQATSMTDRNGTTHTYAYDVLARLTMDSVQVATGNPENVDTTVLSLGYSFDTAGRPYQQTSYSGQNGGGSIVNQVTDAYNGFGQLTTQQQNLDPTNGVSGTVQYNHSETNSGTENDSRLTSMVYPGGRVVDYGYTQTLDAAISRVDEIKDDSSGTVLEAYAFLGLRTIVQRSHPETGIDLTYIQQSGDPNPPPSYAANGGDRYTGLDRFGRVVDQYWVNPSAPSSPTDDFQYAYDRDGNPLYSNVVNQGSTAAAFSQLYHANGASEGSAYDSLNRLSGFAQGTLSASGTNGSVLDTVSSASNTQSWSLDALGNWSSVTTNGTTQGRTLNGQNQITGISGSTTPTYDNNGNTTTDDQGLGYLYDAWNRMVSAYGTVGGQYITEDFGYLAGGQRASLYTSGSTSGTTTFYSFYSNRWQELEDDVLTAPPLSGSSSLAVQDTYAWGIANVDELIARDDASGNRLYPQQDANGDVTAIVGKVSGAWQVVERFTYNPYGSVTVLSPSWASTADAYSWVYLYQGGRYDATTGLYNFRNRDYSPTLGRWMQNDPAGYVQGANLYEANLGAPISHRDPYGLTSGSGGADDGGTGSTLDGTPAGPDFPKPRYLEDPNDSPPTSASSGGPFSPLGTVGSSDDGSQPSGSAPGADLPPFTSLGTVGSSDDGLGKSGTSDSGSGVPGGPGPLGVPMNPWWPFDSYQDMQNFNNFLSSLTPQNPFADLPFGSLISSFTNGDAGIWSPGFGPGGPAITYSPPYGGIVTIGSGKPPDYVQPGDDPNNRNLIGGGQKGGGLLPPYGWIGWEF